MIQNKETYQYNALFEEYHPFGTTSYRSGRSETEVSLKRYKYVGKERDEETGLYYYGARYYSAWLCRFVSVDPLAHEFPWQSPYTAFDNNPIKRHLMALEKDGKADIINGHDYWLKYGHTVGMMKLFIEYYSMMEGGSMPKVSSVRGPSKAYYNTTTKSKPAIQKATTKTVKAKGKKGSWNRKKERIRKQRQRSKNIKKR